jgi:hypothetical protein
MITKLNQDEIFVFGSNQAGIHGAGAALQAKRDFGAITGIGFGYTGRCFAIPTKDRNINTLPLSTIRAYVHCFLSEASQNRSKVFLVTAIGCGLAGYMAEQIAPMFTYCTKNIHLPLEFLSNQK